MTGMPTIGRELRVAARSPFTYHLRVIGAASLLLLTGMFSARAGLGGSQGGELFRTMHGILFGAIWVLLPLMTADCISRERREGTLGLLFLTQLRPNDVVVAKGLAHGLRGLTFWLATLPVITVPFLLGGVGWKAVALRGMKEHH